MENARLVDAPIGLDFEEAKGESDIHDREYHRMSESDDDPIAQWLKLAKARGETQESDPVLLNLLVELHRKIDALEGLIKNEKPDRIELAHYEDISKIGFTHFELKKGSLTEGVTYYGRIMMPTYPSRDIPLFFIAESDKLARISRMHQRDEKEWGSYFTARERVMIREMRASK